MQHKGLLLFLLILLNVVVYSRLVTCDFVTYDDPRYVTENPVVKRGLTRDGIAWALTSGHASNWHPLTWLSHMADVTLFKLHAGGHHLTNLVLHIFNTCLLALALIAMTGAFWKSAFVAGLFAVHPLHVESVAWIAERKDVLSAFFFMLSLGAYASYARRKGSSRYAAVLLFFALGLTAKPMIVTLPFVFLLLDYWPLERREKVLTLLVEKVPFLVLSALSCIVTFRVQRQGGAMLADVTLPLAARLQNAVISYFRYLEKTFWPHDLAVFYPHPYLAGTGGKTPWMALGAVTALLLITLLFLRWRRRAPYLPVGWFWFLGMLVPVLGIVQVGLQASADRYTYLPLVGIFMAFTWGGSLLMEQRPFLQALRIPGALLMLGCCAFLSRQQTGYWKNSVTLYEHALAVTENNWEMHNNLGNVFSRQGKYEAALKHFDAILREGRIRTVLRPQDIGEVYYNAGYAEAVRGDLAKAAGYYSKSLQYLPANLDAINNLGYVYYSQGRLEEAIRAYRRVIAMNPRYESAYFNLGLAYLDAGRPEKAVAGFQTFLRFRPDYKDAYLHLGAAHESIGKYEEAERDYRRALRLQGDFPEALRRLRALQDTGLLPSGSERSERE